ncbi:DsbA family protein [Paracoccus contaminans]|uniref:Thiol-disulfide oxidoreductase n=1 Tax=Paracoccus contaminans TaxID=1945662 RepID=A0A1W6CWZ2_9RHOB|nr:DsbA family protein [Paracoccus contaminans]ARJ69387.1 thiol-disulfide oxidoreductase [Paracoccus contaminans]
MSFIFGRILSAAALAALAGTALPAAAQQTPAAPETATATAPAAAPAADPAPALIPDIFLGSESAPVTIYEYASLTCSHCAAFHKDVFPKLKAEYIDTGKVRFAQRDIYFDEAGLWAAMVARCGGDDKFYPLAGMMFDEQGKWLSAKTGEELTANLKKIGAKAGLTGEQIDACWNDQKKAESLVATFQKNAVADKIEGTPTFIIAGETVANAPWEELKAKIDAKIAAAAPAAAPASAPNPAPAPAAAGNAPAPAAN